MGFSSPKSWLNLFFEKVGYRLVKLEASKTPIQVDMDPGFLPIYEKSKTHTMTSMANAGLLASSRFPFAMSRDQLLPSAMTARRDSASVS